MTSEEKRRYFRLAFLMTMLLAAIAKNLPHPSPPLHAGDTLKGKVTEVLDGRTLDTDRGKLQLWGIQVPEKTESGFEGAKDELSALAMSASITCKIIVVDANDNDIARCHLPDNRDLGEMMVRSGWARDYPRFTEGEYKPAEESARTAHLGQWATQ